MNNAAPRSLQSTPVSPVESCKATLFKIADHWFALPATAILKVIPSSALEQDQVSKLMVWDHCPLVRLDLHQLLTRIIGDRSTQHNHQATDARQYFMIVGSQTGERCGIPIDEVPILTNLPLSKAQALPPHYRQLIGNIAQYMIIHPDQGATLSILLLDLQQALSQAACND